MSLIRLIFLGLVSFYVRLNRFTLGLVSILGLVSNLGVTFIVRLVVETRLLMLKSISAETEP